MVQGPKAAKLKSLAPLIVPQNLHTLAIHLTQKLPLFDQAGAPEELEAVPLLLAPPILVPSLENTLGLSMLPSPLLSRPPPPPLLFSFSPFSLLPSRLPVLSLPPAFRLLPLPDFEVMAVT